MMPPEDAPTLEALESESVADTLRGVMEDEGVSAQNLTLEREESDAPELDELLDGRARDEHGRFVSARGEDGEPQKAAPDTEDKEAKGAPVDPEASEPAIAEPPADWSPEQHKLFHALDEPSQKFVLDSVTEAKGVAAEAQRYVGNVQVLDGILAPHRARWAVQGLDDLGALRAITALSEMADRDPIGFVKFFAEQRGVDLSGLNPAAAPEDSDDPYADPEVLSLKRELAETKAQIAAFRGEFNQRNQARTQEQELRLQETTISEITEFRNAKNAAGSVIHPYFDGVQDFMADIINRERGRGKELTLDQAYDAACRADPDVSAKIEAARVAREARLGGNQRREKAAAASRAGVTVSGSPAPSVQHTNGSIRDELRAEFSTRGLLDQPLI